MDVGWMVDTGLIELVEIQWCSGLYFSVTLLVSCRVHVLGRKRDMDLAELGLWLDSVILKVSNLNDSVIL